MEQTIRLVLSISPLTRFKVTTLFISATIQTVYKHKSLSSVVDESTLTSTLPEAQKSNLN